ncbi:MAG TPA: PAS domain S-box protein, partial [Planctomycetota bacterium]|nr:PAS domain S-box protein [Planctomycetota bacterium]
MIGNILEANDAFLNLVGYTREELLAGKVRWEDMTPPEYKSLDAEKVRQLSEEGRIPAFEKEYIHKDGHRIPILLGAALLPGFRDTCIAFVLDLTERKASELERSRLAAIVESSSDAILAKTLDGTITSWNPAAERLYGYTAPEAVGRSVGLIIPPDRHAELRRILERIARGERIEPFETLRRRKDGQSVDVSLTVSPLRDASGKIVGASSIARDITDVKRAHDLFARS